MNTILHMQVAHIQYIGPDSMASKYAYQVCLFHTDSRRTGKEYEGLVTSTLKPLESQCLKDDVFVNTFHQVKNYTDQWGNLNFILRIKRMEPASASASTATAAASSGVQSMDTQPPPPQVATTS